MDLKSDSLSFSAVGNGAQGENNYGFHLQFFKTVDTQVSQVDYFHIYLYKVIPFVSVTLLFSYYRRLSLLEKQMPQ